MEIKEYDVTKVAELLEVLGGDVSFHVGEREGQVMLQLQRVYGLPTIAEVLHVPDGAGTRYVPTYKFYMGSFPTSLKVVVYGLSFPTEEEAQRNVDFWKPKVTQNA